MKATLKHDINEKIRDCGMMVLSNEELFAIVTDLDVEVYKTIRDSLLVEENASRICETFEAASYGDGKVSKDKALKCKAVIEIARRMNMAGNQKVDTIHGPEDVYDYLKRYIGKRSTECFVVLLMNTKNHIIGHKIISEGSLTASVVHPREVFEAATKHHAASMILAHNHPSGDPSPSREDIAVTRRLVHCGEMMDIPVLDHIIIGNGRFASLKEKRLMGDAA